MSSTGDEIAAAIEGNAGSPLASGGHVVTFGEGIVRLTASRHERLARVTSLDVSVGGHELNTAAGLVSLGVPAAWVSAVPDSPLGRLILYGARAGGVDISQVIVGEDRDRAALSFVEPGPDPRPTMVHDDAADSALCQVKPGSFDWDRILDGASAFHVSGKTLALSAGVSAELVEAIRTARLRGVLVSLDLREPPEGRDEAAARQAVVRMIHDVDVLSSTRGMLRTYFGIEGSYESVLRQAIEKLGVAAAALTRSRAKGSRRLHLDGMAMGKSGVLAESESRDIEVVDRLGAGDAFVAGFLAGYLENPSGLTRAVALGVAASSLAHTTPGEFLCATRQEVEALVSTD